MATGFVTSHFTLQTSDFSAASPGPLWLKNSCWFLVVSCWSKSVSKKSLQLSALSGQLIETLRVTSSIDPSILRGDRVGSWVCFGRGGTHPSQRLRDSLFLRLLRLFAANKIWQSNGHSLTDHTREGRVHSNPATALHVSPCSPW